MILKTSTKNRDAPIAEIKDASLFALFLLNLLYATTSRSIAADPLATPATVATKRNTPRKPRNGTYGTVSKLVKMSDSLFKVNGKKVCPVGIRHNDQMLRSLMYDVTIKGETKKRNMTVGTFVKQNPKGTFFVLVNRHAFTIKDGVVIGNPEDATKTKKIMRCAFEIK